MRGESIWPLCGIDRSKASADGRRLLNSDRGGKVYVATDEHGTLLGFIVFYEEANVVILENVAVFPDATGRCVGKALVKFCEDTAHRRGAEAFQLYTHENMLENLQIDPRLGYVEIDRRTEDGFNRVYFEKSLPKERPDAER